METPIEQFEHAGLRVQIFPDADAQSPDDWGNDDLFLIANHRQFDVRRSSFDCDENTPKDHKKEYNVLPLFAYIHSGVALSLGRAGQFGDMWDSGQVGWVLVKKNQGFRNIRKAAQSLIEEWNSYLSGEVYGFVVERVTEHDEDCDEDLSTCECDGEHVDSCWGFVGDIKYCRDEAKSNADAESRHEAKQVPAIEQMMHGRNTMTKTEAGSALIEYSIGPIITISNGRLRETFDRADYDSTEQMESWMSYRRAVLYQNAMDFKFNSLRHND